MGLSCSTRLCDNHYLFLLVFYLSDVSGGYHPSVFDALRVAIHASKALGFGKVTSSYKAISHHEGFYLATLGGAQGIPPHSVYEM